jgi:hypothetical protein
MMCNLISNLGISFCLILRNSIALLFTLFIWKCFKICNVRKWSLVCPVIINERHFKLYNFFVNLDTLLSTPSLHRPIFKHLSSHSLFSCRMSVRFIPIKKQLVCLLRLCIILHLHSITWEAREQEFIVMHGSW